jgi:hypothetical protein
MPLIDTGSGGRAGLLRRRPVEALVAISSTVLARDVAVRWTGRVWAAHDPAAHMSTVSRSAQLAEPALVRLAADGSKRAVFENWETTACDRCRGARGRLGSTRLPPSVRSVRRLSISPANFSALLDWLEPRAATGTAVETTAQVIGGPVMPPVAP